MALDRAEARRGALLKQAGLNVIRTSHNPPSVAFLNACDRQGMRVLASGDYSQTENYQGKQRQLFQGKAQLILRTTKSAGTIAISAEAQGLKATTVTLEAKPRR